MSRINKEWHERNRMPARAGIEQRIEWHGEHVKHCACRPIPEGVKKAMRERGLPLPPEAPQGE